MQQQSPRAPTPERGVWTLNRRDHAGRGRGINPRKERHFVPAQKPRRVQRSEGTLTNGRVAPARTSEPHVDLGFPCHPPGMKQTSPPSMGPPLYTSSPIRKKPIRKPGSPRQAMERDKSNTRWDGHIVNISRIPHVPPAPWHQVITTVRPKAPVTSCVTLASRPVPLEGGEAPGQGKAQDLPAQEKLLQHITMCVKPTTGCSEVPRAALCVAPREYKPYHRCYVAQPHGNGCGAGPISDGNVCQGEGLRRAQLYVGEGAGAVGHELR